MHSAQDLNSEGARHYADGDLEAARLHCQAALQVDPGYWMSHANLSVICGHAEQLQAALAHSSHALRALPNDGSKWNNHGNILMRLGRHKEADEILQKAAELSPDDAGMWHNRGILAYRTSDFKLALEFINRALEFAPDDIGIHETKAHVLLALGDLKAGLVEYEFRWFGQLMHLRPWDFHIPEWTGQSLEDKTILLHSEQGFGDAIMCSRFAKNLLTLGASKVTLGLDPALKRLFEIQEWPNVSVLDISRMDDSDAQEFDFQTPMFGALRWLDLAPADIRGDPYLGVPGVITPQSGFHVGLCWASGKRGTAADWRRRQVPLELLLPLAEIPDVRLWSLQVGDGSEQIQTLGAEALIRTMRLPDFLATAQAIEALDLIITVDSAIAHLAAALGRPTWILSPFTRCWRWWDQWTGRPWYNTIRQFRQANPHEWSGPVSEIVAQLPEFMASEFAEAAQ